MLPGKRWKIFFWFLFGMEVLSLSMMVLDRDPVVEIISEVIVYSLVLLGVFGYAYSRRLLNRLVWKSIIPVALIYDAYGLASVDYSGIETAWELVFLLTFVAITLGPILIMQYITLFRYAYRSTRLWR